MAPPLSSQKKSTAPPLIPSSHHHHQALVSLLPSQPYYTPSNKSLISNSFDSFEPISSNTPLHLFDNNNLIQIQENQLFSNNNSMQGYYPMKDNFLTFGSEQSCSSSDGSCSQIKQEDIGFHQGFNYSNGFEENNQKFMLNYGSSDRGGHESLNQWSEKPNGYFGEIASDYSLEDVKQLISCSNINGCNNENNINFFSSTDQETKLQDSKVMYHYFNYWIMNHESWWFETDLCSCILL